MESSSCPRSVCSVIWDSQSCTHSAKDQQRRCLAQTREDPGFITQQIAAGVFFTSPALPDTRAVSGPGRQRCLSQRHLEQQCHFPQGRSVPQSWEEPLVLCPLCWHSWALGKNAEHLNHLSYSLSCLQGPKVLDRQWLFSVQVSG